LDSFELTGRLAIALAIGLMIGIERGWRQRKVPEGDRAAGLRTHTLAALLGGVWGALTLKGGTAALIALAIAFAVFSAIIALFRYREMVRDGTYGATTVVAAMLAFALGAFAVAGDVTAAAAAGAATALILALKAAMHEWLKRLTWEELRAGLVLLAMTAILLPLLPNREIAPWFPVNPCEVWLLTIMIAALSFAGYIAIRLAGDRLGVLLSGVAGGLVSSTAVTLSMAKLAREHPGRARLFAAGILLASATMMLRLLVIAAVVNASLLIVLAAPLALAALAQAGIAAYYAGIPHAGANDESSLELRNPFDLGSVLQFGALLALIMALAKGAAAWMGPAGTIALAAVSGLVDVDAISISLARLAPVHLAAESAVLGIIVAVAVNSVAKLVLGITAGGLALGRLVASGLAAGLAAALAGYAATLFF
jgi:uncharacterized membrane protein (DUF4010 family)